MRYSIFIIILLNVSVGFSQSAVHPDTLLSLCMGKDELVDKVIHDREKYKLQFLLTEVGEDSTLFPTIEGATGAYYYPASLVKLPVVLATLEKLKRENIPLDAFIRLEDELEGGDPHFIRQTRSQMLTFRTLIEEIMVVSDNDYFNVLYHFVTPGGLNHSLRSKGLEKTLIYRCFSGCSKEEQLKTVGLTVYYSPDSIIYTQEATAMGWEEIAREFSPGSDKLVGDQSVTKGKVVKAPYDFNYNLEFPLRDLHSLLQQFILPAQFPDSCAWGIRPEDRSFLLEKMTFFPGDLSNKKYADTRKHPDNSFKIIAFGDPTLDKSRFTTYSKIGYSYGFISESAYVVDHSTGRTFFLTVSMYVNRNNIVNDGRYEYSSIATPFVGRFTHIIADLISENKLINSP